MSLLVTFVLLDGQIADNASFDCLTKCNPRGLK